MRLCLLFREGLYAIQAEKPTAFAKASAVQARRRQGSGGQAHQTPKTKSPQARF
jgi:hypothetical protein